MVKDGLARFGSYVSFLLFIVALWVLQHALAGYHYHDVLRDIAGIAPVRLLLALAPAAASYVVLTGYDTLAFRFIEHPLPYTRIAFTSFIGYAFSQNIGHSVITGGSIRFRLYSAWVPSSSEIVRVVLFGIAAFWLGLATLGGVTFALAPAANVAALRIAPGRSRSGTASISITSRGFGSTRPSSIRSGNRVIWRRPAGWCCRGS